MSSENPMFKMINKTATDFQWRNLLHWYSSTGCGDSSLRPVFLYEIFIDDVEELCFTHRSSLKGGKIFIRLKIQI